jgi:hypothetical protein
MTHNFTKKTFSCLKYDTKTISPNIFRNNEFQITVLKGQVHIVDISRGLFGELAILYNCRRTATITARSPVVVWVLARGQFQTIVKQSGSTKEEEKFDLLSSVNGEKKI